LFIAWENWKKKKKNNKQNLSNIDQEFKGENRKVVCMYETLFEGFTALIETKVV